MQRLMGGRVIIRRGDITKLDVEAVVTAANSRLAGGGGVDGAVHRAAGPELLEACRKIGGCPTGEARVTPAFRLNADLVVHAVGPVWHGGERSEDAQLASAYESSLVAAVESGARSVAFPCISTGVYGFPFERATEIALGTVAAYLEQAPVLERVVFCCFSEADYATYLRLAPQFF